VKVCCLCTNNTFSIVELQDVEMETSIMDKTSIKMEISGMLVDDDEILM
jgi:hypothetical protein